MAKRKTPPPKSDLDAFLDVIGGAYESLLAYVATEMSKEPMRLPSLRKQLREKFQRVRYPYPEGLKNKKTFYEVLQEANVLSVLFSRDVLTELWKCLQVKAIVERVEDLQRTEKTFTGFLLKFHRMMKTEIMRHRKAVTAIAKTYGARDALAHYRPMLIREYYQHAKWLNIHGGTGRKQFLLGAATYTPTGPVPRDTQLATQIAIYWVLDWAFSKSSGRKKGINDLFVRMLAQLIEAPPNVSELRSDSDNLRKAIMRHNR